MLQTTHSDDPNVQEKIDKLTKRDRKTEQFFRWVLKIMEWIIAGITLIALVGALGIEVVNMVTEGTAYFASVSHMLHNLLSIVVGLEFVRMLIDTTPANILEVLTVAITRHVILSHDDPWSNVACIACIAGLFAIRRFWCAAASCVRKWWCILNNNANTARPSGWAVGKTEKAGKSRSNAVICPACESIRQTEIYFFLVVIRSNKHPIKNPMRVPQVFIITSSNCANLPINVCKNSMPIENTAPSITPFHQCL